MKKLTHSFAAYRRAMQMSSITLFVFVEGLTDRYFYSQLINLCCSNKGIDYDIITPDEIENKAGGKTILLELLKYLKSKKSLFDDFNGKKTVVLFFLDKDVDDFLRKKCRSQHVIYTEYYELENYLFIHGDIAKAAAISAFLDMKSVSKAIGNSQEWMKNAANCWKEWVTLCLFSHIQKINCMCTYGQKHSAINDKCYANINQTKFSTCKNTIKSKCKLDHNSFNRSYNNLSKKVDKYYRKNQQDIIFKGKWYIKFLIHDIKRIAASKRINESGLDDLILSNLINSINFKDGWLDYFYNKINPLLG